ncbi:MAG: dihydroneopterin aldolase [Planctomycetaceae bacterium]|nr:dihydroneopterin aldolase [Planctomycetaceae bacterium]
MPDTIEIRDLLLRAIVGINPDERVNRQDVLLNLLLETDLRPAARSDGISDAVNYRTIAKEVIEFVEQSRFNLVEALAEAVAALCLRDERVSRVRINVQKPGALRFASSVGVTIERTRADLAAMRRP